jgi:hypothetical protein
MKKLNVTFHINVDGLMEFEVSDDFTLSGKQADEIWEEFCENYPDQIEIDILNEDLPDLSGIDLGGFTIDFIEVDSITHYSIEDSNGKTIENQYYIDDSPF